MGSSRRRIDPGSTALTVVPLRSAAMRTGTCSRERPRFFALPPRRRALRPSPRAPFPALQDVGLVRFHDPLEYLRIAPRRHQKPVTPAERRAHRHIAACRRGLHRLPLRQRQRSSLVSTRPGAVRTARARGRFCAVWRGVSREENARIKAGETPAGWEDKPAKRRQKDVEARWTKKHGKSHYGYKNHVNVDRRHKLVRRYHVSDAAEHDSQVLDDILDGDNTALGVWADSAYRSAEIEAVLKEKGLRSRIHRKGRRNKPLSEREKQGNKTRSSVRVRVEHVFGAQSNDMGGTLVRSVGLVRAKARIGLKNLAYNMRRLVQLERLAAAV